jgi:uncharacterized protein YgiM (DUF1202 family)
MKNSTHFSRRPHRLLAISVALACATLAATSPAVADALRRAQLPAEPLTGHGTVKADRSNVRSRPSLTAEVIVQLHKGDTVEVRERKTVTERDRPTDWLRIGLPAHAKCYVSSKFLADGVVTATTLNVRCGPGANFRDIGKLSKGTRVEILGTEGDWTQIKPTPECSGWIAAELVELAPAAPTPEPATQLGSPEVVTPPVAAPPAPALATAGAGPELLEQYVVKDGVLRAVEDPATAPASYQLMTPEVERRQYRIAYVEAPGLNLQRFDGKHVRVLGTQRWRKGERYPVIVADRVDMIW